VVLQFALILFFTGLLNQLWHLDGYTVASFVSLVVVLTVSFLIVTTVLPAHSVDQQEMTFVPFRSPQAWTYFTACQWVCSLFEDYFDVARSWTELDREFLKGESSTSHDTSVHRALRWAFLTLGNAIDMEKSVFQCMSNRYLPPRWNIYASPLQIGRYILSGEACEPQKTDTIELVYYDLCASSSYTLVDRARGRFQAELLVKRANEALDLLVEKEFDDSQGLWQIISTSCQNLLYSHQIFYMRLGEEANERQCFLE